MLLPKTPNQDVASVINPLYMQVSTCRGLAPDLLRTTADYCGLLRTRFINPQLVSQFAVSQQSAMPLVRTPQSGRAPVHMPTPTLSFDATAI